MSKRDLKQPSTIKYYKHLASSIPDVYEDKELISKLYLAYADKIEKEEQEAIVKYKKRSYAMGKKFK